MTTIVLVVTWQVHENTSASRGQGNTVGCRRGRRERRAHDDHQVRPAGCGGHFSHRAAQAADKSSVLSRSFAGHSAARSTSLAAVAPTHERANARRPAL